MSLETLNTILLLLVLAIVTYLILVVPKKSSKNRINAVLVDTSVFMDGRILSVVRSGFLYDQILVPRSVIGELQLLADGSDNEKRARARHGLDVIAELQNIADARVEILRDNTNAREGVDNRLLELAKKHDAAICTIDYNLNKVATVEGIRVLNINELAQELRIAHLPGEKLKVTLTQKGQDGHQAVGHLQDGTMVVVEQSNAFIGKTVDVEVIRSLQTVAGKMIFARRSQSNRTDDHSKKRPSTKQSSAVSKPNTQERKPKNNNQPNNKRKRNFKTNEDSLIDLVEKQ